MANRWWACSCCSCSPNLTIGGVNPGVVTLGRFDVGGMTASCAQCTVYIVTFRFASEAAARHYVGEGNYIFVGGQWLTEEWVLFGDASSHSRDDARPIPLTITTETHPIFPDTITPTSINLSNGAFIWTRRSNDPDSQDFGKFDLTTGAEFIGGDDQQWCVGISARTIFARYFYPTTEHPPCMTIGFTGCEGWASADATTDADSCQDIDGWCWLSGLSYYDESDPGCPKGVSWFFPVSEGSVASCGEPSGSTYDLVIARLLSSCEDPCQLQFAWGACTHDARECPEPSDLVEVFGGGTITSISCSTCGDAEGDGSCPPEDCPVSYCKWEWDVDSQAWELISSNCLAPSECPGPPDDPDVTDKVWTACNCCVTVTPGCTCDDPLVFEPCLTQDCTWIWLGTWDPLDPCSDITCECQGRPDDILDPGGFIGEIRDGCCCKEIV
jgi:hypothetical protein